MNEPEYKGEWVWRNGSWEWPYEFYGWTQHHGGRFTRPMPDSPDLEETVVFFEKDFPSNPIQAKATK